MSAEEKYVAAAYAVVFAVLLVYIVIAPSSTGTSRPTTSRS